MEHRLRISLLIAGAAFAIALFNNCSQSGGSGAIPSASSQTASGTPTPTPTPTPATGAQVVAKGSRILAMDTNDPSADFSFLQSYSAAQALGVRAGTYHLNWNVDEASGSGATSGTFTDTFSGLSAINGYYPATSPASLVSLTVAPIDTTGPVFPTDLNGQTIDNANVISRFNKFMDWILSQTTSDTFSSIQIGNEIDVTAGAASSTFWSQYKTFLTAVVSHLHTAKPGLKVGVTVTLYGLTGQGTNGTVAQAGILSLLPVVDELGLTYYPLDSAFQVKNPSVVSSDFAQVFQLVGSKPIYFQEVGLPTSSTCGGTTEIQTDFIDQIFTAWDAHASQIPFLSLLRMNDYSAANAVSVATKYNLQSNPAFVAYLQTLGFRTYTAPSSTKPAWTELQNQTHLRGWW